MDLFLIDAIGPFFRNYKRKRVNWSKIPFMHLESFTAQDWSAVENEIRTLAAAVSQQGYNAVTLDDLAHLAHHPAHLPETTARINRLRGKFSRFFDIFTREFGLRVFLTTDAIPLTPAVDETLGTNRTTLEDYYRGLVRSVLDDFPQLSGLILRIGESDGNDVTDPIRTRLHLRNAKDTNRLLKGLLPEFESRDKQLIFRTWTVGAHPIGDLIWHRDTLANTLDGIHSRHLIVSMKHGESDFFRYLPLNKAFFRIPHHRKLIELQARREYEGAGEYPSFIGWDCQRFARELKDVPNMAGISVWCQTGGWHRFRRRAFLETDHSDIWIRLNTAAAIGVFKHHLGPGHTVANLLGNPRAEPAIQLLRHADTAIHELFYIGDFARQKLFFRRVRIPPVLHIYWDSLFINNAVRNAMQHFVTSPARNLRGGEIAADLFPEMIALARNADLPVRDIEHMRDFFSLVQLARHYYFLPHDDHLIRQIKDAKAAYKNRWPRNHRYRIRASFSPFPIRRSTLTWASRLLLRRKRGYRIFDHLFTIHLSGLLYRMLKPRDPAKTPKFLRKSAMGIDSLFK
ncbi:MAG: hypothetical protein ACQCXQ_01490 [Verrucomicrobiales bacterium]|nr:hypothetical protein [Verrucomicrobiota bacterium JB025]